MHYNVKKKPGSSDLLHSVFQVKKLFLSTSTLGYSTIGKLIWMTVMMKLTLARCRALKRSQSKKRQRQMSGRGHHWQNSLTATKSCVQILFNECNAMP